MKKISLILFFFFLFGLIYCQNNLGDSKNNSTIKINDKDGGMLSFNLLENRIIFSYAFITKKRDSQVVMEISGASKDKKIASLFEKGNFNPDFKFSLNYSVKLNSCGESELYKKEIPKLQEMPQGADKVEEFINKHQVTTSAQSTWLTISVGLTKSAYSIFNENSSFKDQIRKESFAGYKALIGINYWNANILSQRLTCGVNFGYEISNNIDTLGKVTVENIKEYFDSTSNTKRVVKNSTEVFRETPNDDKPKFYEKLKTIPLNVDLFLAPINLENIGFYLYSRSSFVLKYPDKTNVGFGMFFFRDNDPLKTFGGIIIEACDIFDNLDLFDSNKDRYKISLTIGINVIKI